MRHASTTCHARAALSTPHPCLRSFPVKLRSERDSVAATDRKFDESADRPSHERERERERFSGAEGEGEREKNATSTFCNNSLPLDYARTPITRNDDYQELIPRQRNVNFAPFQNSSLAHEVCSPTVTLHLVIRSAGCICINTVDVWGA